MKMECGMNCINKLLIENGFWAQVFISFLGAFFGFLFAIFLEAIVNIVLELKKSNSTFNSLIDELEELGSDLKSNVSHDEYFRYDYSVWKTAESSGGLLSISQMEQYKQLVFIYSNIYFADLLEQQYFDLYKLKLMNNTQEIKSALEMIDIKRKEKKQKIFSEIESFVKENAQN
jgi:hypothetical protein